MSAQVREMFNSEQIGRYTTKLSSYVKSIPKIEGRKVGIEIEIEGFRDSPLLTDEGVRVAGPWKVKRDGSLRNNGAEFVSDPILPADADKWIRHFYQDIWKKTYPGMAPSERTGIHVHVDVRDFSYDQLTSLTVLYALVEPMFFSFVGKEREEGIFCVPWYRAPKDMERILAAIDRYRGRAGSMPVFLDSLIMSVSKYSALFVAPIYTFGTVEFRHAPTWESPDTLLRWVKACHSLVEFAKDHTAKDIVHRWLSGPTSLSSMAVSGYISVPDRISEITEEHGMDYRAIKAAGLVLNDSQGADEWTISHNPFVIPVKKRPPKKKAKKEVPSELQPAYAIDWNGDVAEYEELS